MSSFLYPDSGTRKLLNHRPRKYNPATGRKLGPPKKKNIVKKETLTSKVTNALKGVFAPAAIALTITIALSACGTTHQCSTYSNNYDSKAVQKQINYQRHHNN